MLNEKLHSIGGKLGLSGRDLKAVQTAGTNEKLADRFVYPILIAILSILTSMAGISLCGGGCINCAGYPYVATELGTTPEKRKKSIMYGALIPIMAFMAGCLAGKMFFGYAIKYNVYKKSQI